MCFRGGGGSAEYGQRPYFYKKKIWTLPKQNIVSILPLYNIREESKKEEGKSMLFDHTLLTPSPEAHLWSLYCKKNICK